jgi:hypothetical protein
MKLPSDKPAMKSHNKFRQLVWLGKPFDPVIMRRLGEYALRFPSAEPLRLVLHPLHGV